LSIHFGGGGGMSIYSVMMCVVKPEKQAEFLPLMKKYLEYQEENKEKFRELKSFQVFNQMIGTGAHVLMWEYDSLTDFASIQMRFYKDEEWMKFSQELMLLVEPATLSMSVWNAVM